MKIYDIIINNKIINNKIINNKSKIIYKSTYETV